MHRVGDTVDHLAVRRVQRRVARLALRVGLEPDDLGGVVACVELEHLAQLLRAVEMERRRLHPRIVRVARVVDVAAIDDVTVGEELVDEPRELRLHPGRAREIARLLLELALD
eukprot:6825292-Prymnesium_polylepis.1